MSVTTNEELTDILEIHHINLVMINGNHYNDVKKLGSVEKVCKFLKSENINEMERIVGVEESSEQEKFEIAKKMLKKNTNIDFISEITGLTIDEISNIKF